MSDRFSLIESDIFNDNTQPKFVSDPRVLVFKESQSIECRLIRFTDKLSSRTTPWVIKAIHSIYTELESESDERIFDVKHTTCPSSGYLNIRNWKEICPICKVVNSIYEKLETKECPQHEEKKLRKCAKTLKRKFKTFIPAYIISDSLNPENAGTVKILMFNNYDTGFKLEKYIKRQENPSKYFNNFSSSGYNLSLEVDSDNVFEIKSKFTLVEEGIIPDFDAASFMNNYIKPLKFDEEFYDDFNRDKMDEFYNSFVIPIISKINLLSNQSTNSQDNVKDNETSNDDFPYVFSEEDEAADSTSDKTKNDQTSQELDENNNSAEKAIEQILENPSVENKDKDVPPNNEKSLAETQQDEQNKEQNETTSVDETLENIEQFLNEVQI